MQISRVVISSVVMGTALFAMAEDYTVTVGAGDADVVWSDVSEAGPAGLLAGDVKDRRLVKMGGGRLVIQCDLKTAGYTGEIKVQEGYLQLKHDGACGTSAGGVVVVSGATLEGESRYKSGSLQYQNEPLTFEGFGVNGTEGAVKMLGGSTWNFFSSGTKTMTGDALWNGTGRLDVRAGTFDMGGHTFYGTNSIAVVNANVINPGKIVFYKGTPSFEGTSINLNGDASNEMIFDGEGMEFTFVTVKPEQFWTMAISNTVTFYPRMAHAASRTNLASAVGYNRWGGPIYIASGMKARMSNSWIGNVTNPYGPDPYHHLINFNGKISGPGGIEMVNYSYLRLKHKENDFTGGVKLSDYSILEAAGVGSLGSGTLSVGGNTLLEFLYGELWEPGTMTDTEYARIFALKRTRYAGKAFYYQDANVVFSGLPDYSYADAISADIYHNETNTLTLTGTITGSPKVVNTAGTLVLGGDGDNQPGEILVRDGTLRLADGKRFYTGDNVWKVLGTYPMTPRFVVGEGAILGARNDTSAGGLPHHCIGGGVGSGDSNRDFARGILEILPGAIVTNMLFVGGANDLSTCKTNNMGSVFMRGGTLVLQGNNSKDQPSIGADANGYFEMTDGFIDTSKKSNWFIVGKRKTDSSNTPGHGVFHVKGGRFEHNSVGFVVGGGGGFGHMRVSGGAVSNDILVVGRSSWLGHSGGEGVVTVDGTGDVWVRGNVQLGSVSNFVSVINMNGGTLHANALVVLTNSCQMSGSPGVFCDFNDAGNPVYVNFGGGRYRPTSANSWHGWLDARVVRYTVYAGGAAVDIGSNNRELFLPFRAPTGNGVKSVPFACDEPWRYIGAPYVRIVDPTGSGFGATACADFDSTNGVVTGVTVTSPGCDYGEGTYAEIGFGGWTNTLHVPVELAANDVSGGFTKYGTGALYIASTNDWHGVTRIAQGSMYISADDVLPCTAGVQVDDGCHLYLNGHALPAGTLAGTGTVNGDFTLSGKLTVDAADLIAGKSLTVNGALTIQPGAVLEILNPELLSKSMPRRKVVRATGGITGSLTLGTDLGSNAWMLSSSDSAISFGYVHGATIIVR